MGLSIAKKDEEKKLKSLTMWTRNVFFADECCDFSLEKTNLPDNTLLYVNQGYPSYKEGKKCYYNDIYIVAQIVPLAHRPKDFGFYDCKDDEVKIYRAKCDLANKKLLGIEYCVALITVKKDPKEQLFDYGYVKANPKTL